MELTKLPTDLLVVILSYTTKKDLKALCLVSKFLYSIAAPVLYRSVSVRGASAGRTDRIDIKGILSANHRTVPSLLYHTQDLEVTFSRLGGCSHGRDLQIQEITMDDEDGRRTHHTELERSELRRFNRRMLPFLGQLQEGRLRSFTWNVAGCVPLQILGPEGYLVQKQQGLKSLRLVTSPRCNPPGYSLKCFTELTELSWSGFRHHTHFAALRDCLSVTAGQLRELDLDCFTWPYVQKENLQAVPSDTSFSSEAYFTRDILKIPPGRSRVLFPTLRRLSLAGISLTGLPRSSIAQELGDAINFRSIRSLKLRFCPGWADLLRHVGSTQDQIHLHTLEIHDDKQFTPDTGGQGYLVDFLNAIHGLEELFYYLDSPVPYAGLPVWRALARHESTLTSFVYHIRGWDPFESRPADYPESMPIPKRCEPALNPLKDLGLAFIGLSVEPESLKNYVAPYTRKSSLKVIHCRQSCDDVEYYGARGIASEVDARNNKQPTRNLPKLTSGLDEFAQWAFGPEGIHSLEIIAFGDFAYGGIYPHTHVLLCRQRDPDRRRPGRIPGKSYRHVISGDRGERQVIRTYRDALQACPTTLRFMQ